MAQRWLHCVPVPRWVAVVVVAGLLAPGAAAAHALRFGVLSVIEEDGGRATLHLRASGSEGQPPALRLAVEGGCALASPPTYEEAGPGLLVLRAQLRCTELGRARVVLRGLAREEITLAVRLERRGAPPSALRIIAPRGDAIVLVDDASPPASVTFASMASLGAAHLAGGLDHLAFVLLLALAVVDPRVRSRGSSRALFFAITGFTLGHATTLAISTLGALRLPSAPVEACIALSIALLAAELLREGPPSLTLRYPATAAALFGLVHGLGFAGALGELGLPRERLPMALLGFHLGIETAQLAFLALLALVAWLHARAGIALPRRGLAAGIAVVATAWTALRVEALG